jgi:hypothetical protein
VLDVPRNRADHEQKGHLANLRVCMPVCAGPCRHAAESLATEGRSCAMIRL